jgi:hypothetical protein
MAGDGEHGQSAEQAGAIRPELAEEKPRRRAWAKPAMYRFSLQRTLAGSGVASDGSKATSAFPT